MEYQASPSRGPHRRQDSAMSTSSEVRLQDNSFAHHSGFEPTPVAFEDSQYHDDPMERPKPNFAASNSQQRISFAPPKQVTGLRDAMPYILTVPQNFIRSDPLVTLDYGVMMRGGICGQRSVIADAVLSAVLSV
ncbi:hypothetical protein FRC02_012185 [Tulasnella sp. 418]|nr:hypothetical protein FRC02_012185 [Tulasnella sp. 418]